MDINKVILCGTLLYEPDVRYSNTGKMYCVLDVETVDKWASGSRTESHRCVAFDKVASAAIKHVKEGDEVMVDGKIQYRIGDDNLIHAEIICDKVKVA